MTMIYHSKSVRKGYAKSTTKKIRYSVARFKGEYIVWEDIVNIKYNLILNSRGVFRAKTREECEKWIRERKKNRNVSSNSSSSSNSSN